MRSVPISSGLVMGKEGARERQRRTGSMVWLRLFAGCIIASALVAASSPPPTFCERLAPKLGMKLVKPKGQSTEGDARVWKQTTSGGLKALFSGQYFSVSFRVDAVDSSDSSATQRLGNACAQTPMGAKCVVPGPAVLTVGKYAGNVSETVKEGERPIVEMRGASLFCRNGPDS